MAMNQELKENGYVVIRNFFDDITVELLQTYFHLKERHLEIETEAREQYITAEDNGDVCDSLGFYGDGLVETVALTYGQKACSALGMSLSPTYTFARIYKQGSKLLPHTDRPSCEISATCPIFISDNRASTIFVSNYTRNEGIHTQPRYSLEEIRKMGDYTQVDLLPGDAMFYSGCERFHWRDPLQSDMLVQFFMHFVDVEGPYSNFVFDRRPYMGFPSKFRNTVKP